MESYSDLCSRYMNERDELHTKDGGERPDLDLYLAQRFLSERGIKSPSCLTEDDIRERLDTIPGSRRSRAIFAMMLRRGIRLMCSSL